MTLLLLVTLLSSVLLHVHAQCSSVASTSDNSNAAQCYAQGSCFVSFVSANAATPYVCTDGENAQTQCALPGGLGVALDYVAFSRLGRLTVNVGSYGGAPSDIAAIGWSEPVADASNAFSASAQCFANTMDVGLALLSDPTVALTAGFYRLRAVHATRAFVLSGPGPFMLYSNDPFEFTSTFSVTLTDGAAENDVFWLSATSINVHAGVNVRGTVVAYTGQVVMEVDSVAARALANRDITLNDNSADHAAVFTFAPVIAPSTCAGVPPTNDNSNAPRCAIAAGGACHTEAQDSGSYKCVAGAGALTTCVLPAGLGNVLDFKAFARNGDFVVEGGAAYAGATSDIAARGFTALREADKSTFDSSAACFYSSPDAGFALLPETKAFTRGFYRIGTSDTTRAFVLSGPGPFVFYGSSSLQFDSSFTVTLTNGAAEADVFWLAAAPMSVRARVNMRGTVFAVTGDVFLETQATVYRALASGSVFASHDAAFAFVPISGTCAAVASSFNNSNAAMCAAAPGDACHTEFDGSVYVCTAGAGVLTTCALPGALGDAANYRAFARSGRLGKSYTVPDPWPASDIAASNYAPVRPADGASFDAASACFAASRDAGLPLPADASAPLTPGFYRLTRDQVQSRAFTLHGPGKFVFYGTQSWVFDTLNGGFSVTLVNASPSDVFWTTSNSISVQTGTSMRGSVISWNGNGYLTAASVHRFLALGSITLGDTDDALSTFSFVPVHACAAVTSAADNSNAGACAAAGNCHTELTDGQYVCTPGAGAAVACPLPDMLGSARNFRAFARMSGIQFDTPYAGSTSDLAGNNFTPPPDDASAAFDAAAACFTASPDAGLVLPAGASVTLTTGFYRVTTNDLARAFTLSGPGPFVFYAAEELYPESANGFSVRLAGPSASDVFWTGAKAIIAHESDMRGSVISWGDFVNLRHSTAYSALARNEVLASDASLLQMPSATPASALTACPLPDTLGDASAFQFFANTGTLRINPFDPYTGSTASVAASNYAPPSPLAQDAFSAASACFAASDDVGLPLPSDASVPLTSGFYRVEDANLRRSFVLKGPGKFVFYSADSIVLHKLHGFAVTLSGASAADVFWTSVGEVVAINVDVPGTLISWARDVDVTNARALRFVAARDVVVSGASAAGYAPAAAAAPSTEATCGVASTTDNANAGACVAAQCHIERIGPDYVCRAGRAVNVDALFYNMDVRDVVVTTPEPRVMHVSFTLPIFQPYDTVGWFNFFVGGEELFSEDAMGAFGRNDYCTSMEMAWDADAYPRLYSSLVAPGGACHDLDMSEQRALLRAWIDAHHYPPWFNGSQGEAFTGNRACWEAQIGRPYARARAPVPAAGDLTMRGLVARWDTVADVNRARVTLRLVQDLVVQHCRDAYAANSGVTYTATNANTPQAAVAYGTPVTVLQRTSHRQQISMAIYTSTQVMTSNNVTVSTAVYQPVNVGQLLFRPLSVQRVKEAPVDPNASPASAHSLGIVLRVTVPQPRDGTRLRVAPGGVLMDASNCYGAVLAYTGTCTTADSNTGACVYEVKINSTKRTDQEDGESFAYCSEARPVQTSPNDKLYPFTIRLQRCDNAADDASCADVAPTPIQVVPSFYVPSLPLREVTQNEQIFGYMRETAEAPLDDFATNPTSVTARRFITATDTINIMVAPLPALWTRYATQILPEPEALRLYGADGTAVVLADEGWTVVAQQDTLAPLLRQRNRLATALTVPFYAGCGTYIGCDGVSWEASAIIDLVLRATPTHRQAKFVLQVTIVMEVFQPASKASGWMGMVRSTIGRWVPMAAETHTVTQPVSRVAGDTEPYGGTVSSTFVFVQQESGSGGGSDSVHTVALIAGSAVLAAMCCIVVALVLCLRRAHKRGSATDEERCALSGAVPDKLARKVVSPASRTSTRLSTPSESSTLENERALSPSSTIDVSDEGSVSRNDQFFGGEVTTAPRKSRA